MSKIAIKSSSSGTATFTIESPATNTDRTLVLPDVAGTVATAESTLAQFNVTGSAPVFACRAFVSFNASLVISGSGNISSITNNSAGDFTLNFTTAMPDSNYSIGGFVRSDQVTANSVHILTANSTATKSTTAVRLVTRFSNSGNDGQFFHPETCVQIFR